jgi:hypothetical protein
MPVTISDPTTPTTLETEADGTPTSHSVGEPLAKLTGLDTGKVTGSAGRDRATLSDLAADKDQVIKLGEGDDFFIFGVGDDTGGNINGIVDMGVGGNDAVYLTHSVEDYIFTLRSDGSIKVQYVGDDTDFDGAAVTFKNADQFVFRNIDPSTGVNYTTTSYSTAELTTLIQNGDPV